MANSGGFILDNVAFNNIYSLTLTAGAVAKTDKDMSAAIDQGKLKITKQYYPRRMDYKMFGWQENLLKLPIQ